MLVLQSEGSGAGYQADPLPPARASLRTITIPLERFELGACSRGDDDWLRLE